MLIDQLLDRTRVHLQHVLQIENHTRVEAAAARAHRKAVDRSEAHRACDAASPRQRAHARAVAQVEHNGLARRRLCIVLTQCLRDEFIRQAMKSVAPHATLGNRPGQRERLRERRLATVKSGVEACNLRHVRQAFEQRPDRREIVRLMQWRQRNEFFELGHHRRIDQHRRTVGDTSVHHAVADCREVMLRKIPAQEQDQVIERAFVAELRAVTPRTLGNNGVGGVLRDEARRREQSFGLAPRQQSQIAIDQCKQRELDA